MLYNPTYTRKAFTFVSMRYRKLFGMKNNEPEFTCTKKFTETLRKNNVSMEIQILQLD